MQLIGEEKNLSMKAEPEFKEIKSKSDVIDIWQAILESGAMGIPEVFLNGPFTPAAFTNEDIEKSIQENKDPESDMDVLLLGKKVDSNNDWTDATQSMVDGFISP